MKKYIYLIIILIFTINLFSLNIVTSIKPLELITKELVPDANITTIYENSDSFFNLKIDSKDFNNVDLFVVLDKEIILSENSKSVVLSEGVLFYPYKENPFIWTDPLYTVVIAYKIEKKLESISPENANEFRNNLLNFTQKLVDLSDSFSKIIKDKKINILDINETFIHFYKRYNIKYATLGEDETITKDKILVYNINYDDSTFDNLKNKKILVDIFASQYDDIINFYKTIIDALIN
ncbi:metal ABC transporter solute-binding protein, Zn/Mn family [Marinitoga litoralis]|uniref:metal ABC transporter solute-binding protein, Zn/Mn family n=1 Tax=Marinitoga litoralis TaxID=570855 RepID=UPI00195FEDA0|nr:zinc ABC transporter substrate-binding protein [Marinitoga litoralis]MBM7559980.1 ABC-type Zn uptake system ZnuABC Zn-binding protein ZnuA [Marinitoga litoralis]